MLRLVPALLLLLTVAACGTDDAAPTVELTTAQEVTDAMRAAFEANVGSVDGFTVRTDGAEARYTVSDDTSAIDRVALELVPTGGPAARKQPVQLLYSHVPNVARLTDRVQGATLEGLATRDGRRAYVLVEDDVDAMTGGGGAPTLAGDRELRVYVDPETFDVLEIYESFETDSTAFTTRLIYSDFREADGLRLPYTIRQVTTGLNQNIPENERIAIGGQIGFSMQQAEQMPEGPERRARLAELESEYRRVTEGIEESEIEIDAVTVGVPDVSPAPAAPPPSAP